MATSITATQVRELIAAADCLEHEVRRIRQSARQICPHKWDNGNSALLPGGGIGCNTCSCCGALLDSEESKEFYSTL